MDRQIKLLQLPDLRVASENAAKAIATTVASQGIGHASVANPKRKPRTPRHPMHRKGIPTPLPSLRISPSVQPTKRVTMPESVAGTSRLTPRVVIA